MKCIQNKIDAIDRITHMGSVRGTSGQQISSGIALQTEFQLLNAKLSEKADFLENAEEQIWSLFAKWQNKEWDGSVDYPDTFDVRDWANDLQFLQMAKASGIKSETFNKELDKQIAEAVIDDNETIKTINDEIDSTRTTRGQFTTTEIEDRLQMAKKKKRKLEEFQKIRTQVYQRNILAVLKEERRTRRASLIKRFHQSTNQVVLYQEDYYGGELNHNG